MKLVFILGGAAVGKMTVGQALMELTGLRLFHKSPDETALLIKETFKL